MPKLYANHACKAFPAGPPECHICGRPFYSGQAVEALRAHWRLRVIKGELKWRCYLCSVFHD